MNKLLLENKVNANESKSIFNQILDRKNIKFNPEELSAKLNNCKTLHSSVEFKQGLGDDGSASSTDKYIIKIRQVELNEKMGKENEFFMKVFLPDIDDKRNEGLLQNEIDIYRHTNISLAKGYTRNFIPMVAYSDNCTFDDICLLLSNKEKCSDSMGLQLLNSLAHMYCKYYHIKGERPAVVKKTVKLNKKNQKFFDQCAAKRGMTTTDFLNMLHGFRLGFVMTKKTNGMGDFWDFLKDFLKKDYNINNKNILFQYIFQIVYTIQVLATTGITHNDLHMGNILLDKPWPTETQEALYILPSGHSVLINTAEIPRIFDFDRATHKEHPNRMDSGYDFIGQSRIYSPYRDTLIFFCKLIKFISYYPDYKDIYTTLVNLSSKSVGSIDYVNSERCHFPGMNDVSKLLDDNWIISIMKKPEEILELLADLIVQEKKTSIVKSIVNNKNTISEEEICTLVKNTFEIGTDYKTEFLSELLIQSGVDMEK